MLAKQNAPRGVFRLLSPWRLIKKMGSLQADGLFECIDHKSILWLKYHGPNLSKLGYHGVSCRYEVQPGQTFSRLGTEKLHYSKIDSGRCQDRDCHRITSPRQDVESMNYTLNPGRTHARFYNTSAPHSWSFFGSQSFDVPVVSASVFMIRAFDMLMIGPSTLRRIIEDRMGWKVWRFTGDKSNYPPTGLQLINAMNHSHHKHNMSGRPNKNMPPLIVRPRVACWLKAWYNNGRTRHSCAIQNFWV